MKQDSYSFENINMRWLVDRQSFAESVKKKFVVVICNLERGFSTVSMVKWTFFCTFLDTGDKTKFYCSPSRERLMFVVLLRVVVKAVAAADL